MSARLFVNADMAWQIYEATQQESDFRQIHDALNIKKRSEKLISVHRQQTAYNNQLHTQLKQNFIILPIMVRRTHNTKHDPFNIHIL
jgi:hypothetical protein